MGDFRVTGHTRLYVVLYCTIITAVLCTGLGKCPVYPQLPNFDVQRMQGRWYEVERSFYLMEMAASCTQFDVSVTERGYLRIVVHLVNRWWYEVERSFYLMEMAASCTQFDVSVTERGYLRIVVHLVNRWTGNPSTTVGLGIPNHNGSSTFRYKLNNRMPYIIGRLLPGAGQYTVLFTDYERFAIVWSCTGVSVAHADRMWILGREREIEAPLRAQIYAILEELRLDPDRLIVSKHTNCTDQPPPMVAVDNTIN